jgi:hypothetical protein
VQSTLGGLKIGSILVRVAPEAFVVCTGRHVQATPNRNGSNRGFETSPMPTALNAIMIQQVLVMFLTAICDTKHSH